METFVSNLTPQLENLTNREAFEAMVGNVGGKVLVCMERCRRANLHLLEPMLSSEARAAFHKYADACSDAAAHREAAAVRVGLALGVGVGAALATFTEEQPAAISSVAAEVVSSVIGAPVPAGVAHDCALLVLRTLQRAALMRDPVPAQGEGEE